MFKIKVRIPNFPGKEKITRLACTGALKVRKQSPTILIAVGIGGAIGATVLACKATLNVDEVLDQHDNQMQKINDIYADHETYPEYTEQKMQRDKFIVYSRTIGGLLKLYSPAIILGSFSIACVIGSHYIMTRRQIALMAAYTSLNEAFNQYRKRIAEEIGEDREKDIYQGYRKEVVEETVETKKGTKTVKKETSEYKDGYSIYARCFAPGNEWYKGTTTIVKSFLMSQQSHANDLLRIHGYLFLSDVYQMLGFPETKESRIVGWVYGNGDSFVDFGIFDKRNIDFINGIEEAIWLDFNVDGVIYDMI